MNIGRLLLYTGDGKGKTTAAFGLALRAKGHDQKVVVFQFCKAAYSGEAQAIQHLGVDVFKDQPTFFLWAAAKAMLEAGYHDLIILDELAQAINTGELSEKDVLKGLGKRMAGVTVVVTGRKAPKKLTEVADVVTNMTLRKHDFYRGQAAEPGVEY
jgi:cob(I)alamin adenosyltransferase